MPKCKRIWHDGEVKSVVFRELEEFHSNVGLAIREPVGRVEHLPLKRGGRVRTTTQIHVVVDGMKVDPRHTVSCVVRQ